MFVLTRSVHVCSPLHCFPEGLFSLIKSSTEILTKLNDVSMSTDEIKQIRTISSIKSSKSNFVFFLCHCLIF